MKRKFWHWFARHWSTTVLVGLWVGVVVTNYAWGTRLAGWDNLLPELAPLLDLGRSCNSLWQ